MTKKVIKAEIPEPRPEKITLNKRDESVLQKDLSHKSDRVMKKVNNRLS